MAFWGCTLKPGEKHELDIPEGDLLHLSQACLHEPKGGKNYLQVSVNKKTFTVACLEKDKREHESLDLFFQGGETTFSQKGASEMHLVGYLEPRDGDDDEEEETEDEDDAPAAKAAAKAVAKGKASPAAKPASPAAKPAASPKAAPKASPKASPKAAPAKSDEPEDVELDMEDEEGEEEEPVEESEEEQSEADAPAPKAKAKATPKATPKASPKASPKAAADTGKRKAQQEDSAAPAKKAKGDDASGKDAKAEKYIGEVYDYLKKNGKTAIAMLGSKVHRPKELPKLGALLGRYKDKFTVTGDSVEAK